MNQAARLSSVEGYSLPVLASVGLEQRARPMAERVVRAREFFTGLFGVDADGGLVVLAERDWHLHSTGHVYGMPHYEDRNIVVAGEPTSFWRAFAEALRASDDAPALEAVYGPDVDLSPFFDLLTVHELAHLYPEAVPFRFPTAWLLELFVNVALHGYVAELEPELLPVLEAFPRAFVALGAAGFQHTSLADFERLYPRIPAANYGWYQAHLHVGAKHIYDADGVAAVVRMWNAFAADPPRLADRLESGVGPEAARVLRDWPG